MTTSNGNLFDLTGRVALITGGNGGLGLGMALGLANAGADIAIAARNAEKNAAAVAAIESAGRRAFAIPTDVTSDSDIDDMAARAVAHFGRIDILVNNAGATVRKAPEDIAAAEWDKVLDVNLRAAFLSCRAVYPHFKAQGGRQDNQHRQYVQHLWRRGQRRALFVQQGRHRAAGEKLRRSLGRRQHPVQRHPARLVYDRADPSHTRNAAGTLRPHQPAHPYGTLGRRQRIAGGGGVPVQPGVGLCNRGGDYGGRGVCGGVTEVRPPSPEPGSVGLWNATNCCRGLPASGSVVPTYAANPPLQSTATRIPTLPKR